MIDPKEKQKLYILFAIFGILGFVVYNNFLLKPQFLTFSKMNKKFSALKRKINKAERLIANEKKIEKEYEDLKKEAEISKKKLPAQDEISTLLGDFSSVAKYSGVSILKIKPLEAMKGTVITESYREFPILIEAKASYHQCGMFLNELENMDRFIEIVGLDIKGTEGSPRRHDIILTVKTYIMQ